MEESIPVVDMQQLSEQEELNGLREACEKWGCFRLINHPIPATLMADMKMVTRSLFDLPVDIKKRNTGVITDSGYRPPNKANPLYEALGLLYDKGSSRKAVEDFCSQLDASAHQRKIIEAYTHAILDLALSISQKMAESLGVVGADFKDWPTIFRIIKYNFTPEVVGSSGVQLHSDAGFLTLLQDDENVSGLEVMDNSGSFVAVPPKSGSFLVNAGDIAHVWSNGRFCNVKHRVQCKEATSRLSIGAFMLAPSEGNVGAPAELVDPDHPRLYSPFNYEEYRQIRISAEKRSGEALQLLRC